MVEIEIDGQTLQAEQGSMIIEVADANNIRIPRFCYHKKLSVAANCRMCLVEVEKMPKTVPACATPVTPGMKVFTHSPKALDSQRAVMEFLLINHPLDCPICDQGGECELQDNSIGYGLDTSPYEETKRVITDENIGPLVETNLTRCIQCTRCVRFGQEVAGLRELGMTGRGEDSEIRTFVRHALDSEVSANIIDLCPVGALTSKPFLYTARPWELDQAASVAPHDALGSNIYLHTRRDEVMRVVPRENEEINETWLSDRDRFSYTAINSEERLLSPMIKRNGQWLATDWETALTFAVNGIKTTQQKNGAQSLVALSSPSATLEEYYLLARLCRALNATDVSYHLRDTDLSDSAWLKQPHFGATIADIEQQKNILLVGCEIMREMPLLGLRFRKATLAGANVDIINPADFAFNFNINAKVIAQPQQLINELAAVLKVLLTQNNNHPLQSLMQHPLVQNAQISETHRAIAQRLQQAPAFIYLGAIAYHLPQAASIRLLTAAIAAVSNSNWGMHTDGSNTAGLAQLQQAAGIEHQSIDQLSKKANAKAILLHNIEPELDCANPHQVAQLLQQAEIVVACTPFKSSYLSQVADVLLPIATLAETSGSFINLAGTLQNFQGYVTPRGEARPAWKVFRVLANLFELADFTYTSTQDVIDEIKQTINFSQSSGLNQEAILQAFANQSFANAATALASNELTRLTQWPIYRIDNLVRRSEPLQNSGTASSAAIYLNQATMKKFGLAEGDLVNVEQFGKGQLTIKLNDTLANDVSLIPAGFSETAMLGDSFGRITLSKVVQ